MRASTHAIGIVRASSPWASARAFTLWDALEKFPEKRNASPCIAGNLEIGALAFGEARLRQLTLIQANLVSDAP